MAYGSWRRIPGLASRSSAEAEPPSTVSRQSRSLTYLFCDLVDSTGLIGRHDGETAFELIDQFRTLCRDQIEAHQGFVANDMGDGMLGYFGYPIALESNAEAACHCALLLQRQVRALPGGLSVRIGIASGRGVLDSRQHSGRGTEVASVSSAANLASRLQAQAEPDQIMVSAQVYEQMQGLFRFDAGRVVELKGFDGAQTIHALTGHGSFRSRSHQRGETQPCEMVGRAEDVRAVLDAWREMQAQGGGRSLLVRGPGGIGKTTLLRSIQQRLAGQTKRVALYSAWFAQHTALHPLRAWFEDLAAARPEGFPEQWLARRLPAAEVEEYAELVRILLGRGENTRWMPNILREKTIAALTQLLLRAGRQQPLLLLLEDAHWLDPTSAEVLERLQAQYADSAILVLASARAGPGAAERLRWDRKIDLARLHQQEVAALISGLDPQHQLNEEVRREIARKGEGMPLLIREFTRATLTPASGNPCLVVPDTLLDSFVAQLDLWSASKDVLDVAASTGGAFTASLIALALQRGEDEVGGVLQEMAATGLLGRYRMADCEHFDFSHALLREAAYAALLPKQRKELHTRVLRARQALEPQFAQSQPSLAAHHLEGIGAYAEAIKTLLAGAQGRFARSQFSEAGGLVQQALRLLPEIKPRDAFVALELRLQTLLGLTLTQLKGFGDEAVNQVFSRAWDICREMRSGGEAEYQAIWGIWGHKLVVSETRTALHLVAALGDISRHSGRLDLHTLTRSASAVMCFVTGEPARVPAYAAEVRADYSITQHGRLALAYSMDPLAQALMFLTHSQAVRGDRDAADRTRAEVLAHAERLDLEFLLPYIRIWSTGSALYCGTPEGIVDSFDQSIALAHKLGISFWVCSGLLWKANAYARLGQLPLALQHFEQGLGGADLMGLRFTVPYFRALHAWTLARSGNGAPALATFEQCLRLNSASGELCYQAEIHRLYGEALLHTDAAARKPALDQFVAGLKVAQLQQAGGWEKKIVESLGQFGFDLAAAG